MKKVLSKILLIMLVVIMVLPLKAQKSSYKNFEEKIKDYQKNNIYWSIAQGDDKKLIKEQKEKHLFEYRKKMMNILSSNEKKWTAKNESWLSKLYYQKINLDRYKEIEDLLGVNFEKIQNMRIREPEVSIARKILFSDIFVIATLIDKKDYHKNGIYDYSSYSFRVDSVLAKKGYYTKNIPDTIRFLSSLGAEHYIPISMATSFNYNLKDGKNPTFLCTLSKKHYEFLYNTEKYYITEEILKSNDKFDFYMCRNINYMYSKKFINKLSVIKELNRINDYNNFYSRRHK